MATIALNQKDLNKQTQNNASMLILAIHKHVFCTVCNGMFSKSSILMAIGEFFEDMINIKNMLIKQKACFYFTRFNIDLREHYFKIS